MEKRDEKRIKSIDESYRKWISLVSIQYMYMRHGVCLLLTFGRMHMTDAMRNQ